MPINNATDDARDDQAGSDQALLTHWIHLRDFPGMAMSHSLADSDLTDASQL